MTNIIGKKRSLLNLTDKEAKRRGLTRQNLLEEFTSEHPLPPKVDGEVLNMKKVIDDIEIRQERLLSSQDAFLATISTKTPLETIKKRAATSIQKSSQIGADFQKTLRELDRMFESFTAKYGDTVTPLQLNAMRREMNRRTKAFKGDLFVQDASNSVGGVIRSELDRIDPRVRTANAEWIKLQSHFTVASSFDNQAIRLSTIEGALGRYFGAVVAGTGIATGSGSLVIAGLAAHVGGDQVSNLIRKWKFGRLEKEQFINTIRSDERVVQELLNSANGTNREFLERQLFLPEGPRPPDAPPRPDTSGGPQSSSSGSEAFGGVAGLTVDDEGNVSFNPAVALAGVGAVGATRRFGGDPRRRALEKSLRGIDRQIRRTSNKTTMKHLLKGKKLIEKEIDKLVK